MFFIASLLWGVLHYPPSCGLIVRKITFVKTLLIKRRGCREEEEDKEEREQEGGGGSRREDGGSGERGRRREQDHQHRRQASMYRCVYTYMYMAAYFVKNYFNVALSMCFLLLLYCGVPCTIPQMASTRFKRQCF